MIKKLFLSFMAVMLVASVGFASPLTDYTKGKTSIDLTYWGNLDFKDEWVDKSNGNTASLPFTVDATWSYRITTGLGNKFALQYENYKANALLPITGGVYHLTNENINLLYKFDDHLSVFVGNNHADYFLTFNGKLFSTTTDKNRFIAGVVGNVPINKKTTLFGILGFGRDLNTYEIGVSYKIDKNLELNASYKALAIDNKDFSPPYAYQTNNIESKGVGYGLTYKF